MKSSKLICTVALALGLAVGGGLIAAAGRQPEKNLKDTLKDASKSLENKAKDAATKLAGQPDHDEMMAEMMKMGQPGPEHKELAKLIGVWTCVSKFNMPGPDGKIAETTSKGEATFTSELGGRWIRQDFKGDLMGMPYAGMGLSGYDNVQKKYVSTWMDNMSTSMMTMTGTHDQATNSTTLTGDYMMPDGTTVKSRYVSKMINDNEFIFSMFHTGPDGNEVKEGEITYTRKK